MSASGSRAATLRLIGGRPTLDLVNTISWRGDPARREDHLRSPEDCLVWSVRAGVLIEPEAEVLRGQAADSPAAGQSLIRTLHRLRGVVADYLVDPPTAELTLLQPVILDALRHSILTSVGGAAGAAWTVETLDAHTAARRIALDLLDQLTEPPGPIGVCADDACRWAYVDTSRRRDRRWCSSEECGNRERARRHQATRTPVPRHGT